MKIAGIVRFEDVEGGVWLLEADDGESYVLRGGDAALRKKGIRVEVTGSVSGGGFGIDQMGTPTLQVKKYTIL